MLIYSLFYKKWDLKRKVGFKMSFLSSHRLSFSSEGIGKGGSM